MSDLPYLTEREQIQRVTDKWSKLRAKDEPTEAQTLEALEDSIAHWKRMQQATDMYITGTAERIESPGSLCCSLCALFHARTGSCHGCPVREHTGLGGCKDTPHEKAHDVWYNLGDAHWVEEWRAAAQNEIDFLEEVLLAYKNEH